MPEIVQASGRWTLSRHPTEEVGGTAQNIVETEQQHGEPSRRDPMHLHYTTMCRQRQEGSSPDLSQARLVAFVSTQYSNPAVDLISLFF